MTTVFDALIIGGGPAGVSCAVWLARLGFTTALIEAHEEIGGLCRTNPFFDDWNATLPGVTGPQVADQLALSLERAKVPLWLGCEVSDVRTGITGHASLATCALTTTGGQAARVGGTSSESLFLVQAKAHAPLWRARHLVLATGVRARSLAGSEADAMRGLLVGPGAHIVAQDFRKKRVAVLGGGDNAFENALYALEHGASVAHVYARNVRAQHQFVRQLAPELVFVGDCEVDAAAHTVNGQPYDVIMVFYGWEPCVAFADSLHLKRSDQGFVQTDALTAQTSCRAVYAIGEVAQRLHPCVVTALADGVTAAKAIQASIESVGRQSPDDVKVAGEVRSS